MKGHKFRQVTKENGSGTSWRRKTEYDQILLDKTIQEIHLYIMYNYINNSSTVSIRIVQKETTC